MKKDEAQKIISMALESDGGCSWCAATLIKIFINDFPEFKELAEVAFKEEFGKGIQEIEKIKLEAQTQSGIIIKATKIIIGGEARASGTSGGSAGNG